TLISLRRMTLPRLILPLAACAALIAGGCGSSDDDGGGGGGGGGSQLSKAEDTKQAEKICTDAEKATDAQPQPTKVEDIKPYFQKNIDTTQKALDEFKQLKPPSDLQDKHQAVVDAEQAALDKLQDVTDNLKGDASDTATVQKA